jgi:hypothetical protein
MYFSSFPNAPVMRYCQERRWHFISLRAFTKDDVQAYIPNNHTLNLKLIRYTIKFLYTLFIKTKSDLFIYDK